MKKLFILLCAALFAASSFAFTPDMNEITRGVAAKKADKARLRSAFRKQKRRPVKKVIKEIPEETRGQLIQILDHMEQYVPYFDDGCRFIKDNEPAARACYQGAVLLQDMISEMKDEPAYTKFNVLYLRYYKLWASYQRMLFMLYDKHAFILDEKRRVFESAAEEHNELFAEVGATAGIDEQIDLTVRRTW